MIVIINNKLKGLNNCFIGNTMAKTITAAFDQLKSNLEITDYQEKIVSERQKSVREVIEKEMEVIDSFLTGSYSRKTLIAPLNEADIDIFMVLDPSYYSANTPASLLDTVKRVLRKTYTKTPDISRNGQAVTIRFTDFIVDVVPGFNRKGGGFIIPNSLTGSWISTDPKKHVEIMSAANRTHDGDFIPLVKMIKAWNKTIDQYFLSFHIEVLLNIVLTNVTISNYPSGVRYFYEKARDIIDKQNPDPAGYGGDVGGYISTQQKISEARTHLQKAYEQALSAEENERMGYIDTAFERWKGIFGDYFPSYG